MTTAENILTSPGTCCRCDQYAAERITVALVQGNSGPGWSHEACIPCAHVYASSVFAPDWLTKDLARLDAVTGARPA